jgi:hypothetical protein
VGVVDLFAGSGNLMVHIAEALSAQACGLDADEAVWRQTDANLRIIGAPTYVRPADWRSYFDDPLKVDTTVYVLSPPWGNAFSFASGLDLARTDPPIPLIVDTIAARDLSSRCYAVVQHTPVEPVLNVSAVTDRSSWESPGRTIRAGIIREIVLGRLAAEPDPHGRHDGLATSRNIHRGGFHRRQGAAIRGGRTGCYG